MTDDLMTAIQSLCGQKCTEADPDEALVPEHESRRRPPSATPLAAAVVGAQLVS